MSEEYTTKEKKEILKHMKALRSSLRYFCESKNRYWKVFEEFVKKETKEHDRFRGEGITRGITKSEEITFFCVKPISDFLYNYNKTPEIKDILWSKESWVYACALVQEYGEEGFKEIISESDAKKINSYDYCKLI